MNKVMIGLLTMSAHTYNYGGLLQEMALQDALDNLGFKCEIIDYSPGQIGPMFPRKLKLKKITKKKIINKLYNVNTNSDAVKVAQKADSVRKYAFDAYRKNNIHLSAQVTREALYESRLKYDVIICGSDQIWNPDFSRPEFFLDFAKSDQKKVIYAASIGRDRMNKRMYFRYAELMKDLDCISVREKSAQEMLTPYVNQDITVTLDPTLLHDTEYWKAKASQSKCDNKNYIFCYFLDLTEEKVKAVKEFARKQNKEIIQIPYLYGRYDYLCKKLGGHMDAKVDPADFLKLILDADCILTDSFHASVFSLIFKKQFWVFGRKTDWYHMNTRLDTLLGYFGAEDRLITPQDLSKKEEKITYGNDVLADMRDISYTFIKESIAECKLR